MIYCAWQRLHILALRLAQHCYLHVLPSIGQSHPKDLQGRSTMPCRDYGMRFGAGVWSRLKICGTANTTATLPHHRTGPGSTACCYRGPQTTYGFYKEGSLEFRLFFRGPLYPIVSILLFVRLFWGAPTWRFKGTYKSKVMRKVTTLFRALRTPLLSTHYPKP